MGNVQQNLSWALKRLAPGTYYWSVQAIDTAFAGSAWAAEEMFVLDFPDTGLVAYYDFEESSGDLIDRVNGNNNGQVNGSWTRQANGIVGFGYSGAGTNNDIVVSDHVELDFASTMTISLWINSTNPPGGFPAVKKRNGEGAYEIMVNDQVPGNGFRLSVWQSNGTQVKLDAPNRFVPGEWTHIVAVADDVDDNLLLYLNGFEVSRTPYNGSIRTTDADTWIGGQAAHGGFIDGAIDELGFWNRALSDNEVSALYNDGNGLAYLNNTQTSTIGEILGQPLRASVEHAADEPHVENSIQNMNDSEDTSALILPRPNERRRTAQRLSASDWIVRRMSGEHATPSRIDWSIFPSRKDGIGNLVNEIDRSLNRQSSLSRHFWRMKDRVLRTIAQSMNLDDPIRIGLDDFQIQIV